MLDKAIKLAEDLHRGQKRKSGDDYIVHPLSVMDTLKRHGFPEEALAAAVLHDIVEDTDTTNLEIRDMFGDRVGFIVNALSKNQKPKNNKELKEKYQKEKENISDMASTFEEYVDYRFYMYLNRFSMGIIADPWIMFIKIADQIDNTSSLHVFNKEKRLRKIAELEEHFLPLYERLTEILTPMYMKKYDDMIAILKGNIEKAKNLD